MIIGLIIRYFWGVRLDPHMIREMVQGRGF